MSLTTATEKINKLKAIETIQSDANNEKTKENYRDPISCETISSILTYV